MKELIPQEAIEQNIFLIRGQKIMLSSYLAKLYDVSAKRLNEQVKRNIKRFPEDFMFQLREEEVRFLRSHFATSSWGGRRYLPYVFTQEGIAMLSSVLNSECAIMVNIQIMRAFVALRRMSLTYDALRRKIDAMENKYGSHFKAVFEALKKLLEPPPVPKKPPIGFHSDRR